MSQETPGLEHPAVIAWACGAIVTFAVLLDPGHLGHDRLGRWVLPADDEY